MGLGRIHAELLGDVAVALAPLEAAQAERLLLSLRAAPLLQDARGRSPIDVAAAAAALAAPLARGRRAPRARGQPAARVPEGALGLDARA